MNLLADTHACAWWIVGGGRLSEPAVRALSDADQILISIASLWEAGIKVGKFGAERSGPLAPWLDRITRDGPPASVSILEIALPDCRAVSRLPSHHGDPFDRMLAAQAMARDLAIVSADPVFDAYGVKRIW